MFPRARHIATIGGVDLRIDPSWFVVLIVLVVTYRSTFDAPGRSVAASLGLATATALLFGLSVLAHELAHALEGEHRGADVAGITLFALGGATALRGGDRRARDEFAVAAVGPWANVVLAAVAGLVATGAGLLALDGVAEVAGVLGWLNLGLALFNLVPGAPLDGGRVLRAGIWAVTGDRHRATVISAWAGIALGVVLLAAAVWSALGGPGGIWAGLWTGAIAAYVLSASVRERQRGRLNRWLARHRADDLAPRAATVGPTATVAMARQLLDERIGAVLVDDGGPVGMVTRADLDEAQDDAPIAPLVRGLGELPRVGIDDGGDALGDLLAPDEPFVLLTSHGTRGDDPDHHVVGLSSLRAIDRRVQSTMRGEAAS